MSGPLLSEDQRKQLAEHRAERIEMYVAEARRAVEQVCQVNGPAIPQYEPNKAIPKND